MPIVAVPTAANQHEDNTMKKTRDASAMLRALPAEKQAQITGLLQRHGARLLYATAACCMHHKGTLTFDEHPDDDPPHEFLLALVVLYLRNRSPKQIADFGELAEMLERTANGNGDTLKAALA